MTYQGIFHLSIPAQWRIPTRYRHCSTDVLLSVLHREAPSYYLEQIQKFPLPVSRIETELLTHPVETAPTQIAIVFNCRVTICGFETDEPQEALKTFEQQLAPWCAPAATLGPLLLEPPKTTLLHLLPEKETFD